MTDKEPSMVDKAKDMLKACKDDEELHPQVLLVGLMVELIRVNNVTHSRLCIIQDVLQKTLYEVGELTPPH